MSIVHDLTIGHLNPEAIRGCVAIALRPLDAAKVSQVIAEFPGLKIEERDGLLVVPWHGREDGARGEAFATRLQAETGCLVADRRNGRIINFQAEIAGARHQTTSTAS